MNEPPEEFELPGEEPEDAEASIEEVILADGRYRLEAYGFLHESLARAVRDVYGGEAGAGGHVSGQQLAESFRRLAMDRYGLMAPAVLRRWGIHASIDIGQMVYLLIDNGFMRKTEDDSVEDFRDVFDLDRDFDTSDEIHLKE
jgi:uncharacterized repeat protein (TIGR04138 family)